MKRRSPSRAPIPVSATPGWWPSGMRVPAASRPASPRSTTCYSRRRPASGIRRTRGRPQRVCQGVRMRKYVFMGVPGSGKSSQAAMLAEDLDLTHINVGDIFRWNVQSHTKMGAQVRRTMAAGELVGDDLAERVTGERLTNHDWNYGFVIDGFPRNARQAEFFLESYDIDSVIHLDLRS